MTIYWRDYKRMNATPFVPPPGTDFLVAALCQAGRIPVVRKHLEETFAGTVGRIGRKMNQARYIDAYQIAVDALTRLRDPGSSFMHPGDWWFIMHLAVDSLEQVPSSAFRESLILRARNGPEPFAGYDFAYTFCVFARWRYAEVRYNEGVDFAALASRSDSTWGKPDVLLGRSELVYGRGEGYQHFIRAVSKDPGVVHEVLSDPAVRRHREVRDRLEAAEEVQAALRASSGSGAS